MTPQAAIAALDRQLAQHGEVIVLRRAAGTQREPYDVRLRAWVQGHEAVALRGRLQQGQRLVTLSASGMTLDRWCFPPRADDQVILSPDNAVEVTPCTVLVAKVRRLGGRDVRWELTVRG